MKFLSAFLRFLWEVLLLISIGFVILVIGQKIITFFVD